MQHSISLVRMISQMVWTTLNRQKANGTVECEVIDRRWHKGTSRTCPRRTYPTPRPSRGTRVPFMQNACRSVGCHVIPYCASRQWSTFSKYATPKFFNGVCLYQVPQMSAHRVELERCKPTTLRNAAAPISIEEVLAKMQGTR